MKTMLLCLVIIFTSLNCIGNRHAVKLGELNHAVSMTAQIYGSDGKIKAAGAGLEVVGDIEITQRYWSLVYSFVPLGDTTAQIKNFNNVVAARGGDAVVDFQIENEGCSMNSFAYLIAPAVLPFFPGCSSIVMRGKIVREVK